MTPEDAGINMDEGKGIRTAVDLFILNGQNQVLLGQRTAAIGESQWAFLGGHQKTGETILECAKREKAEELGDKAQIELTSSVVAVRENRLPPAFVPHLTVIILALYKGGELELPEGEKNREWKWFPLDDLPDNVFSKADEVIENFRQKQALVVTDFHSRPA